MRDKALKATISGILEDDESDPITSFRITLDTMHKHFQVLLDEIDMISKQLNNEIAQDELCQRLKAIEGTWLKALISRKPQLGYGHSFLPDIEIYPLLEIFPRDSFQNVHPARHQWM